MTGDLGRGGNKMKKVEYVRELLKVDEHRERAIRCLEEFQYHQDEAMKRIAYLQEDLQRWQREIESSTA